VSHIQCHLKKNNIDRAFQEWCDRAQEWLCKIPHSQANKVQYYDTGKHRGQVRFQKQCAFPRQHDAHTR
jgi:hypothetical protein